MAKETMKLVLMACKCRDGGIDATIDHEHSYMSSKEVTDIYSTEEPQSAFHARVAFCLDIHNEVRSTIHKNFKPVVCHWLRL